MRRVVVTGAGCITAIGQSVAEFEDSLIAGRSGIRPLSGIKPGDLRFTQTASVPDFRAADWLTGVQTQLAERSSAFAIAASRQAMEQAGLRPAVGGDNMALVFGCSTGGRSAEEPETAKLYQHGGRVHPLTVPRSMGSAGSSLVSMEHGITGPVYTISTACASATHAIGQAFHLVRSGAAEAALAGGHEAPLTYGFLKAWDSLHVVSPTACRPFAADRDGMTLGEGAAMFVLEELEGARARGAPILGEIAGFGMSSDAHHITQAHPDGPAAAMRRALLDARADPAEVDYVNAHGTGTEVNDRVEAAAIHQVFGERARTLPISSTKGLHGHAMGASGAIEVLATLLALGSGVAPVNAGTVIADIALQLDGLVLKRVERPLSLALSNSFAFGGLNAVLALRRFQEISA